MRKIRTQHGRNPSLERDAHGRFTSHGHGYRRDEDYGDIAYDENDDYETAGNYGRGYNEDESEDRYYRLRDGYNYDENYENNYRRGYDENRDEKNRSNTSRRTRTIGHNMPRRRSRSAEPENNTWQREPERNRRHRQGTSSYHESPSRETRPLHRNNNDSRYTGHNHEHERERSRRRTSRRGLATMPRADVRRTPLLDGHAPQRGRSRREY